MACSVVLQLLYLYSLLRQGYSTIEVVRRYCSVLSAIFASPGITSGRARLVSSRAESSFYALVAHYKGVLPITGAACFSRARRMYT
jgi:hypothetical protein